jgi:ABC-2 type transport system permease protein
MRLKLTLRGFRRGGVAGILGLIATLLLLLFGIGSVAVGTVIGYQRLPHDWAVQLLFLVLAGVYLAWIALPLLQYSLNEGLDVTKLQIYPITRAEQMVGLVLATLFDVGTLALVLLYAAVGVGWSPTPAALAVTLVALVLAYVHTVSISQLVLAALMGVLRSRRYRDTAIVVFALLGASCSVAGQFVSRVLTFGNSTDVASIHIDRYLQFTPPGMAARAIQLGAAGDYALAAAWLLGLAALAPVVLYVWSIVLERSITTAESAGSAPSRRAGRRRAERSAQARSGIPAQTAGATPVTARRGPLSPALLAVAGKDARYLWRDPMLKASMLSSLFVLVFVLFPGYGSSGGGALSISQMRVLAAPLAPMIVALNLSLNALGLERQGLQMLYLFPVRPLDVLFGKNLTVGSITFGAQVVLAVVIAAFTGGWFYVPIALAAGLAAVLVLMACGNVTSVLLPFRVRELRAGRTNLSSENGCLRGLLSMLALGISATVLIPVALAVALPLILQQNTWLVASLPLAVVYGAGLHQAATRVIAPRMLTRTEAILNVTTRE